MTWLSASQVSVWRGPSLARLITAKLDAKYAAGRTLDKITNPPIT